MSSTVWRVLSEVYASLKGMLRYKETLFWVIIFPLLWYGLMAAIWSNPSPPTIKVGVYNADQLQGPYNISEALIKAMNSTGFMKPIPFHNATSLREAVLHGKVDVGLIVPGNFTESLMEGSSATLKLLSVKESWGNFAYSIASSFIESFSNEFRRRVINVSISYIVTYFNSTQLGGAYPNWTYYAIRWLRFISDPIRVNASVYTPPLLATKGGLRAYYALSMIGVEALFVGLFTGALSVNEKRRDGTLTVLLASPMRDWELFTSETLAALASVGVSAAAVAAMSIATGAKYVVNTESLLLAVAFLLLGTLFTIGLGVILAALAKTPEGASALVNAIAFPVMFIGGIVIPYYVLPGYLKAFARYWPLSRFVIASRSVLLGLMSSSDAASFSIPAIIATIATYLVGVAIFKKLLARALEYH
ncbi:MAG: ABC transporter permease [Desulfurococcales archaeon]|nr:ABC transporter permease [Desulfurococcales archaeon]